MKRIHQYSTQHPEGAEANLDSVKELDPPKTRRLRPDLLLDLRTLSEQKIALIQLMNNPSIDDAQETALEGLITMVETIQEHAIDEGVEETEVYPHLEPV
jgi:hypothetical protein